MQLAIFLVLCKMSHYGKSYVNLKLLAINSIVLTGGITKVLTVEEIEMIIAFFYKKILTSDHNPRDPCWIATTTFGHLGPGGISDVY